MRWVHFFVIVVFAGAIIVFVAQNFQLVTMSFFGLSATIPLALLAVIIYLLGTVTGSSLLALLRRSLEGASRHKAF